MSQDTMLSISGLSINTIIVDSIVQSVFSCLKMCNRSVRVTGISKIPIQLQSAPVTGMIGANGKCTGFISVTMPTHVAKETVSGLTMEECKEINAQVIDGIGEITNIIAGGIKSRLYDTSWSINSITVPSVILGNNYHISYSKGIEYYGITFELDDPNTISIHDRVFVVDTALIISSS
ncbi:MAG: chemotaxis protein CheX [Thermoguttaceae bacterium]